MRFPPGVAILMRAYNPQVMAYLEAVNDGSFNGSAMKRFLEGHEVRNSWA